MVSPRGSCQEVKECLERVRSRRLEAEALAQQCRSELMALHEEFAGLFPGTPTLPAIPPSPSKAPPADGGAEAAAAPAVGSGQGVPAWPAATDGAPTAAAPLLRAHGSGEVVPGSSASAGSSSPPRNHSKAVQLVVRAASNLKGLVRRDHRDLVSQDDPEVDLLTSARLYRLSRLPDAVQEKIRATRATWDGQPYEALIFEGGGTKGMVYAGALRRLGQAGLLEGVKLFAGTSAGAQTAALCAVGYSGEELAEIMKSTPWDKLLDKTSWCGCLGCIPNVRRLITKHGWCKGEFLESYLEGLIAKKVGPNCTLAQLYQERGVILKVGACNVATRRFELLDYTTHPNMPISKAARASSNIPVVFVPVLWEPGDGARHLYVDGGLEGNIPVKAFPGKRTLAFDLMSTGDWHKEHGAVNHPRTFGDFLHIILDMVMNSAQSAVGVNSDDDEVEVTTKQGLAMVKINCGDHGMLETHLTERQRLSMIAAGWDAVDYFLTQEEVDAAAAGCPGAAKGG